MAWWLLSQQSPCSFVCFRNSTCETVVGGRVATATVAGRMNALWGGVRVPEPPALSHPPPRVVIRDCHHESLIAAGLRGAYACVGRTTMCLYYIFCLRSQPRIGTCKSGAQRGLDRPTGTPAHVESEKARGWRAPSPIDSPRNLILHGTCGMRMTGMCRGPVSPRNSAWRSRQLGDQCMRHVGCAGCRVRGRIPHSGRVAPEQGHSRAIPSKWRGDSRRRSCLHQVRSIRLAAGILRCCFLGARNKSLSCLDSGNINLEW